MAGQAGCALCDPVLGPGLCGSGHWKLVLNHNQELLGKCFLASRRHDEAVSELTLEAWQDLHRQIRLTTVALDSVFSPDHGNHVFLQSQDRHVHLHIVPRYAGERRFAGLSFGDPGYPGHHRVDGPPRPLEPGALTELVRRLQAAVVAARKAGPD